MVKYWITHRRDESSGVLERVKGVDTGGTQFEWTRGEAVRVVDSLAEGEVATRFWDGRTWRDGATVHVVRVLGRKYLRTDKNELMCDNLDELPEF